MWLDDLECGADLRPPKSCVRPSDQADIAPRYPRQMGAAEVLATGISRPFVVGGPMIWLNAEPDFSAFDCDWNSEPPCSEVFQTIDAALYTTDADGWLTYYNDAAAALWGLRPELAKSRWCGAWRLYKPDGTLLPHDRCPMAVALGQGRAVRAADVLLETPRGVRVRARSHPTLLRDAAGAVTGAFDILQPVARRKVSGRRTPHCVTAARSSPGTSALVM